MKRNGTVKFEKQYDRFAKAFRDADESFPDVTRPFLYDLVGDNLRGHELLDLGCGYGKDLDYFHKMGCNVHGIDISRKMLSLAKKRVSAATLAKTTFDNLPYPDNRFDIIFSRYALQHSPHLEDTFQEIHRVLRYAGTFVFLVTHPMRHYFEKKDKNYWQKEDISSVILDGKLTVVEPSHTLSEYLSPFLLSNFTLKAFHEKQDPAAKKFKGFGEYPRVLAMKYQKKA